MEGVGGVRGVEGGTAHAEEHGNGGIEREGGEPGGFLAPADQGGDGEGERGGELRSEGAEDGGVEGVLGDYGVEVKLEGGGGWVLGGEGGEVEGEGGAEAGGVMEALGGLHADDGDDTGAGGEEEGLVAGLDGEVIGEEDGLGEDGDGEAVRVQGAEVFRLLPGPEDEGWEEGRVRGREGGGGFAAGGDGEQSGEDTREPGGGGRHAVEDSILG